MPRLAAVTTADGPVAAAPDRVHALLADPLRLPEWAPGFAQAVRLDGDAWLVDSNGIELRLAVVVGADARTVDFVADADRRLGLFTRVVASGDGAHCLFASVLPAGTPDEAVGAQRAVLAEELAAVRRLVEAG